MKESIKIITNHLREHPDRLLAGWVFNGTDINGYFLINRAFLTIAGLFDDIPKAFRFPGAVQHLDTGDQVLYSGRTVRILDGTRKGILMPMEQVRADEEVSKVGLGKHLVAGELAHQISGRRDGDIVFLQTLLEMHSGAVTCDELEPPLIYLSVKTDRKESVRARSREVSLLTYSPIGDALEGKLLYPYAEFYGHGVVISRSVPGGDVTVRIKHEDLCKVNTPGLRVDVLDYMMEF